MLQPISARPNFPARPPKPAPVLNARDQELADELSYMATYPPPPAPRPRALGPLTRLKDAFEWGVTDFIRWYRPGS
ncbi:MAG: hypothetical protein JWM80_2999 [Cyanobacteria bacterium RYN_339]|nr:hypothetical protein [Cyanobacteria bacterium RYN_339]